MGTELISTSLLLDTFIEHPVPCLQYPRGQFKAAVLALTVCALIKKSIQA